MRAHPVRWTRSRIWLLLVLMTLLLVSCPGGNGGY